MDQSHALEQPRDEHRQVQSQPAGPRKSRCQRKCFKHDRLLARCSPRARAPGRFRRIWLRMPDPPLKLPGDGLGINGCGPVLTRPNLFWRYSRFVEPNSQAAEPGEFFKTTK